MISSFLSKQLVRRPTTPLINLQRRFFDLHEFQSKFIMGKYGVNVQRGALALNDTEAAQIASGLSNKGGLILKA